MTQRDDNVHSESVIGFSIYRCIIKRLIDFCISLVTLICLIIPFIIIAICIKADSKGPIIFAQERVGKNDHPFKILKFRSMYQDAPHEMATAQLENAESHITKVGKFLRKTSLDELPQLINVLLGQMSLVGPRPLILSEKYVLGLRDKNGASKITPGITGLAQVHGRDEISNLQKAEYDGEYAHQVSFALDVKILTKTVGDVLHSRGIHEGKK